MTPQKLAVSESGLNGIARKVLDAVPVSEPWTKQAILVELRRAGSNAEVRVVDGCLETLRGRGLIREPERGCFIRVQAKPKVVRIDRSPESAIDGDGQPQHAEEAMNSMTKPADPLDKLAKLAVAARQLATDIENVALEIEARAETIQRDTEKLRQLQALLKSLN